EAESGVPRRDDAEVERLRRLQAHEAGVGADGRLHRAADREGPGVRSPARPGSGRGSLHDEALRSGRPPREGARGSGALTVTTRVPLRLVLQRQEGAEALLTAVSDALGGPVAVEDADGRIVHGPAGDGAARVAVTVD